jgi:RNA polymerase sigma-54 factor
MSFGQEMRLAQKQVLAPRMIQSMEILQLPILALEERIEQEIQNNETLEVDEAPPEERGSEEAGPPDPEQVPSNRTVDEMPLIVDQEHANQADFERSYDWSAEYPDSDDDRSRPSAAQVDQAGDRYIDLMANMEERPESLSDHLHAQLASEDLTEADRLVADRIIYNLDPNGYLPMPLADLVDPDGPSGQLDALRRGLRVVQGLEPRGVGAREIKECLLLQIRHDTPHARQLRRLITDHLEDLAANRLPLIERKLELSLEDVETLREHLHLLCPKPGAAFSSRMVMPVKPDVYVDLQPDGTWRCRLEEIELPNLRISPTYRAMLLAPDTEPEAREYIRRKVNAAQWLIDAIEQRRSTLLKTAQAIVDHQSRFLVDGPEALEPLKMQQIADRIGMHVTTISRAVDDKWLQTPRGLYPLRKMFVGGTTSAEGDEVAWDAVRMKLQEIVDAEPKDTPYSDDDLVVELAKQGITVARRTVTKYRKAMNIPSSRQRRDWKLIRAGAKDGGEAEQSEPPAAKLPLVIPVDEPAGPELGGLNRSAG